MKTRTYDFRSFVSDGQLVEKVDMRTVRKAATKISMYAAAVPAVAATTAHVVSIDHAFDPVISMLQQMSFPVCSIVIAWACLRAMTGHPAQAVDQAKWAVLGFLAMRYAPEVLRHI